MHYSNEVHARMAWQSVEIFRNFDQVVGGDCGFVQTGYLVFAGENQVEAFQGNVAMQQQVGIQTSVISREDAREIAPGFYVDDCAAIAYEPLSGYADASGTAYAYATRARQLGARVRLQAPATGVEVSGGCVVAVNTASERIETPLAIVATGPWSRRFLRQHGVDLPLEATRHEVVILKRPLDRLPYHPGGADLSHLVYWRPESADLTLVGNGNIEEVIEDPEIYAPRASQGFIQEVWGRLARRIPVMAEAQFSTGYAGLYTTTPDSHPVMDQVEGIEGLYICTGFSGHGFKLSPMAGVLMAELILDGQATTIDISPLRMSRFREGQLSQPRYGFKVLV
jgi:glycine/D-amino acid oxidase-like deaminating enzyme